MYVPKPHFSCWTCSIHQWDNLGIVSSEAATHATGKRKNHTTVKCEQTTCSVGEPWAGSWGCLLRAWREIQETPRSWKATGFFFSMFALKNGPRNGDWWQWWHRCFSWFGPFARLETLSRLLDFQHNAALPRTKGYIFGSRLGLVLKPMGFLFISLEVYPDQLATCEVVPCQAESAVTRVTNSNGFPK